MMKALNLRDLKVGRKLNLQGEEVEYRFCDTIRAVFRVEATGRLREYELTEEGNVKDWNGITFTGELSYYASLRRAPERAHNPLHAPRVAERAAMPREYRW